MIISSNNQVIRKLILQGRLRNPLYRQNAATWWNYSQKYLSIEYYSSSSALRDGSRDVISKPSTTESYRPGQSGRIPSELVESLLLSSEVFLRDPIDWKVVDRIFKKRRHLAKLISYGSIESRDTMFLHSLTPILQYLRHENLCDFAYRSQQMPNNVLFHCYLTCNLTANIPNPLGIYPTSPLKLTATSNMKSMARNATILQLLVVLEQKQLLDAILSHFGHKPISREAREVLNVSKLPAEVKKVSLTPEQRANASSPLLTKAEPEDLERIRTSQLIREIFNYAARYLYIPEYTITFKHPEMIFAVHVSLPEHGIFVSESGASLNVVEAKACTGFKQQAEKYHIENSVAPPSLDDSITLSTVNARNFFDFYNDYNDEVTIDVSKDAFFWRGQAFARNFSTSARGLMRQDLRTSCVYGFEVLIMLVTAVILAKRVPKILVDYRKKMDSKIGKYIGHNHPLKLELHRDTLDLMQRTVEATKKSGLPTTLIDETMDYKISSFGRETHFKYSANSARSRSIALCEWMKGNLPRLKTRQKGNVLPLVQNALEASNLVENNQYSILIGQTGSGKTTQLPQIILDHYIRSERGGECRIICTQPRRIAAKSVAMRVARERGQNMGDQVGHHISSDVNPPKLRGSITYCTTGIILRQLIFHADKLFDQTSHLIIDEVHERDINIDVLLTMIKNVVRNRIEAGKDNPKICLMSATVDAEKLQQYFSFTDEAGEVTCPILEVEGRAFPVKKYYLENIISVFEDKYPADHAIWDLLNSPSIQRYLKAEEDAKGADILENFNAEKAESVIEWDNRDDSSDNLQSQIGMSKADIPMSLILPTILVAHIASTTESGAILIFLPGLRGINRLERILTSKKILGVDFNDEDKFKIFKLHSSIENDYQVFEPVPPGCRKIILTTNIAETSITIADVQYVVDTGKHREIDFNQIFRCWSLPSKWISKSNVKQRLGRAGRVQNGSYYALFSKNRYESLETCSRPEILRCDLQGTCLEVKALGYKESIQDFLAGAPDPPLPQVVQSSIEDLKTLGALTNMEEITPLGQLLVKLPLRPVIGKMVLLGIIYRCLDPMILLGAFDGDTLQVSGEGVEHESEVSMREFAKTSKSDHIAMLNAFYALRSIEEIHGLESMRSYAEKNFLSIQAFRRIEQKAKLTQEALVRMGLISNAQQDHAADVPGAKLGKTLLNENSDQDDLIRALLVHGLHPNIGVWNNRESKYQVVANGRELVPLERSSVNHPANLPKAGNAPLLAFNRLALIDQTIHMHGTTAVTPFVASLFNRTLKRRDLDKDQVEIYEWLPFDVRSADKLWSAEGAAAETLSQFNHVLRGFESKVFRDMVMGKYIANSEMSSTMAHVLREILVKEQDLQGVASDQHWPLSETQPQNVGEEETYRSGIAPVRIRKISHG